MEFRRDLTDPRVDRVVGSFVGLFVGDALGVTLEFTKRDTKPHHENMIGGGALDIPPGKWTDDGSTALCLAASFVETGQFNPFDQLDRYVRWWKKGYMSSVEGKCVDIGSLTRMSLTRYIWDRAPFVTNFNVFNDSGNGGLMRLAPAAILFSHDFELAGKMAELSSRTTHGTPACREAARIFGELIAVGIETGSKEALTAHVLSRGDTVNDREMKKITDGSFIGADRKNISSSGYVVASLHAALWALSETTTFNDGLVLAVNLGDDADTVGAIYGQLAGACYGRSTIREDWLQTLHAEPLITGYGLKLAERIGAITVPRYIGPFGSRAYKVLDEAYENI